MKYSYDYPRPALTSDCVVFGKKNETLYVLLILRKYDPFGGMWAFPGGFVDEGESVEAAALRELEEETGLSDIPLAQYYIYSKAGRDPRGWTVSVGFVGVVDMDRVQAVAGDDAANVQWFEVTNLPPLAFDHEEGMQRALAYFKQQY